MRDTYQVTPRIVGTYGELPRPGTTYAAGLPRFAPDARFPALLPNGPFQITKYVDYTAAVGDPVHRFFQMWQQVDGGKRDLFVWVDETSGEGSQNRDDPASGTNQGAVAMGFYNMAAGDAPYFRQLADNYALERQSPPAGNGRHRREFSGARDRSRDRLLEGRCSGAAAAQPDRKPEPAAGNQQLVHAVGLSERLLHRMLGPEPARCLVDPGLSRQPAYRTFNDGNCEKGAYYLVNNYSAGFLATGEPAPLGPTVYRVPPQAQPTIAEALSAKGVTWKWYSGGRDGAALTKEYSGVCDPLTYSSAIMTSPLRANLQDHAALFRDIDDMHDDMPAVAFVIPPNSESGHPASSTVSRYEEFIRKLIDKVQSNPALWAKSAILVTVDEGGGYWDSGYIQILDAFGDGTRIPLIAVSPFARKGLVDHTYTDHVSILKFIETNWGLPTLSARSRDQLPNPIEDSADPYVPANRPAIGDLRSLFQF